MRVLIEQHLDSPYLHTLKERKQREEVLLPRVEKALSQLEANGKSVTFPSVGKLLSVDPKTLRSYPRVNVLIEQRKSPPRFKEGQARRNEEQVLSEVQRVISVLTEHNESVNYVAIASEMKGISAQTLKTYPQVRVLVDEFLLSQHLYQMQQFVLREEQLLCLMEAAITELEALGKPFTQKELCEKVRKTRSSIRQYPRVNALLEQKLTRHHVYQRRRGQPEEEEILQRVKEAIMDLIERGEQITPNKIAHMVKISRKVLMQYTQVVFLLEQGGYKLRKPKSEREEELIGLVRDAINACKISGQPITKRRLSTVVGIKEDTFNNYPQVIALITQVANEDKQERLKLRFQAREEELTQQVTAALELLRDQNRRITKRAVEKAVGAYNISSYYPKVGMLIERAIQEQHTTDEATKD